MHHRIYFMMHIFLITSLILSFVGQSISLLKVGNARTQSWNKDEVNKRSLSSFKKIPTKSRLHLKGQYFVQLSSNTKASIHRPESSLTLHCKLRGRQRPFATFIWEKDGLSLIASSRRHIRTRLRSERLKVKPVRARDSGKYRCIAIIYGKRWYSRTIKISVKGNLSSGNGLQQRSGTHRTERCELYRGSICSENMNSKGHVYFTSNENQNEIEQVLIDNMKHVAKVISPECYPSVLRVLCVSLLPPCRYVNGTATPMRICKESCMQIRRSHCSKGFLLLRHMKLAQTVMNGNCDNMPEIDSNELCARISPPGNNYKNMLCKRKFRLQALESSNSKNTVEEISDTNTICENVNWRALNTEAKDLLKAVFPNVTSVQRGQFANPSAKFHCFNVALKLSDILSSKVEYTKLYDLPMISKMSFDNKVKGFSVKFKDGITQQLIIPIGFIRKYHLDKKLIIPNVTVYYYAEQSASKLFAEGKFDLCGTEFKIRIEQIKPHLTLLSGRSAHPVDLSTIELAFGLRQPSQDIVQIMKQFQFLKLRLTNPKLSIMWDDKKERAMLFSGKSYCNRWGSVEVNVEFLLGQDRSFWAAAVTTDKRSFKDVFGMLTGMTHVRLAKLLDMSLDVNKVGFILATKDVKIPKHHALRFQYEPTASMSTRSIENGLSLEAHANVKDSCKRNDNRSFICQLVQFATGSKATARIQMKSDSKGLKLVLKFFADGVIPDHSIKFLTKIRDIWNKIDPFSRVPGSNVEITENPDVSWRMQPRYHGIIWLRQLEIYVKSVDVDSLFERNIVYVTGDVVILNKRYNYKINDVGLSYCLRLLDSITETLKNCKSDV